MCSRNPVTVARSSSLLEAAQLMRQYHVGALIVTDGEPDRRRAVGVVTDRDLVLQAMANGIGPRDAQVGEVMTEGLASVPLSADVYDAIEAMHANRVRRLVVSDADGSLVGVVSMDDIVTALGTELGNLAAALEAGFREEREVQQAPVRMTAD
jgi:CBS domain-containing protein